jgi:predicted Zn-ribbon and HTH transcriptional regulator
MSRVPITVMGYRCERCGHEWIPRGDEEPRVCPGCRSPWWNKPRKAMMPYDEFRDRVVKVLREAGKPLTWTEVRTGAGLHQSFPNNQWVHRLETDAGLHRQRDSGGVIHWSLTTRQGSDLFQPETPQAPKQNSAPPRRK